MCFARCTYLLAYLLASGCFWGILRSFPSVQLLAGGGGNARDFWKFQSSNKNPMLLFGRAEKYTGFFGIPVAEWVCNCACWWAKSVRNGSQFWRVQRARRGRFWEASRPALGVSDMCEGSVSRGFCWYEWPGIYWAPESQIPGLEGVRGSAADCLTMPCDQHIMDAFFHQ